MTPWAEDGGAVNGTGCAVTAVYGGNKAEKTEEVYGEKDGRRVRVEVRNGGIGMGTEQGNGRADSLQYTRPGGQVNQIPRGKG